MLKRKVFSIGALLLGAMLVFTLASCSSVESGARRGVSDGVSDGVSKGIAGLFGGGGSSGGSSSSGNSRNSGGSSSAPERNFSGQSQTVPWPMDIEWRRYGLEGLKQPAGTDVISANMMSASSSLFGATLQALGSNESFVVELINGGRPALNDLVNQVDKIKGSKLTGSSSDPDSQSMTFEVPGGRIMIACDLLNGDIAIWASSVAPVN
ncbi:MAG: hypothetical protein LBI04_03740 [Treponema sp.]|jgi:hypothetical protein|nr:hypothetical protein [Treponema sp.]